jgi:hypothetical protein
MLEFDWDAIDPLDAAREPADRWVRFHSLPGGKRYAGNADERAEVRSRARAILGALARAQDELFVTWYAVDGDSAEMQIPTAFAPVDIRSRPVYSDGDDAGESMLMTRYVSAAVGVDDFADLFDAVSDERMWGVTIVPRTLDWRLHPYDGGFDVIAVDVAGRQRLADTFRQWLSVRADGL